MFDISLGAIGAALVAGVFSIVGFIITKESKVSEFRQTWISEFRKELTQYLTAVRTIRNQISIMDAAGKADQEKLMPFYKELNSASYNIKLRITNSEEHYKKILETMNKFEETFKSNKSITSDSIDAIECLFVDRSIEAIKYEWTRVKDGEKSYIIAKRTAIILAALAFTLLAASPLYSGKSSKSTPISQQPRFECTAEMVSTRNISIQ